MLPFFSIITPVYNCEKYIRQCIESVINQTYTSWELILIDDGSTDASGEICDNYCCDIRIKVIHQKNAGALISRIKGISIANGKYELGLDADDYLDSNCLEIIKKAIDISGSDLIFFGFRFVGRQKGVGKCSLMSEKKYTRKEILNEVIEKTNHSLSNKAIKMDKVKQAKYDGIKRKLSINLDYAQIIPILCNIDTGYVIDDILYNYRIYGDTVSHSCKVQHIFDTGLVSEFVIRKLKEEKLLDIDLYNKIKLAYLKMISFRLVKLFSANVISREDCKKIHKSKMYIKSKKVETSKNFNEYDLMFLKLFRYKQYWILKFIYKIKAWTLLFMK